MISTALALRYQLACEKQHYITYVQEKDKWRRNRKEREVDRRKERRRREGMCCGVVRTVASLLPAGVGLQETLAAAEGTQDLASPHMHSVERTADMTCI